MVLKMLNKLLIHSLFIKVFAPTMAELSVVFSEDGAVVGAVEVTIADGFGNVMGENRGGNGR